MMTNELLTKFIISWGIENTSSLDIPFASQLFVWINLNLHYNCLKSTVSTRAPSAPSPTYSCPIPSSTVWVLALDTIVLYFQTFGHGALKNIAFSYTSTSITSFEKNIMSAHSQVFKKKSLIILVIVWSSPQSNMVVPLVCEWRSLFRWTQCVCSPALLICIAWLLLSYLAHQLCSLTLQSDLFGCCWSSLNILNSLNYLSTT